MSEKISVIPLKGRLEEFSKYIPELSYIHGDLVDDIGNYLANNLEDSYTPRDFGAALVVLINGLEEGVQNRNIKQSLLGLPPATYEALVDLIPEITESLCSSLLEYESFVKDVKDFHEELLEREAKSL